MSLKSMCASFSFIVLAVFCFSFRMASAQLVENNATLIIRGSHQITALGGDSNGVIYNDDFINPSTLTIGVIGPKGYYIDYMAYSGSIKGGNGFGVLSLIKTGTNTQVFDGPLSYTGFTSINGGTMALGPNGSLTASSPITVASGGVFDVSALWGGYELGPDQTLNGCGTILGNLTISGIHAPGNSTGIETVLGNYNMLGQLNIDLAGTTVGIGYDQVLLGSNGPSDYTAALGGTINLNWSDMNGSTDATQLWVLKNNTSGMLSGEFSNYANGASLGIHDGHEWFLWYGADAATGNLSGGNDVVISPVPEPAGMVMLGIAVFGLLFTGRRRIA